MKSFDKVGLLKESWEIVKKNYRLVAMLLVAYIVYNFVQGIVQNQVKDTILAFVVSIAFTLLTMFLEIGLLKIALKLIDGKEAKFQDLWTYPQYLLRFIGASILLGLAVLVGFILLIIPGIYVALRLQFTPFLVVDKDMGIMDALKGSWDMTQGMVLNLFLFALLLIAINILGAIALLVGLLVSLPVSFFAVALLYRKLSK